MGEAADCFPEFVNVCDRVVKGRHRWLLDQWVHIDEVRIAVRWRHGSIVKSRHPFRDRR